MIGVIVGSAFSRATDLPLRAEGYRTPFGPAVLHRLEDRPGRLVLRHGLPHRWLPHQIPYRAQAWALREAGCRAVVATSSAGLLSSDLPLDQPLIVRDVLMPDCRLADGSPCTIFPRPTAGQGHLVLEEGLVSRALVAHIRRTAEACRGPLPSREVLFLWREGPRTKTAAENRWFAAQGAEVNSMTLAPELVLANELELPAAGLVVGHKRSTSRSNPGEKGIRDSLQHSRRVLEPLVRGLLEREVELPFANHIYRFEP